MVSRGRFETLDQPSRSVASLDLQLKSPARKETKVRQITGEIEIYLPHNDSASVVVKDLSSQKGKPLVSPALQGHSLSVVVWTKEQYRQYKKAAASKSPGNALNQGGR